MPRARRGSRQLCSRWLRSPAPEPPGWELGLCRGALVSRRCLPSPPQHGTASLFRLFLHRGTRPGWPLLQQVLLEKMWSASSGHGCRRAQPPHGSTRSGVPPTHEPAGTALGQQAPARSRANNGLEQPDNCRPRSLRDNPLPRYAALPFGFPPLCPRAVTAAAQPTAASVLSRGRHSCQPQEQGAPGAAGRQRRPPGSGTRCRRAQGGEARPPRAGTLKSKSDKRAITSTAVSAWVRPSEQAGSGSAGDRPCPPSAAEALTMVRGRPGQACPSNAAPRSLARLG